MPVSENSGNATDIQQPKEEALHPEHYMAYSVLTIGTELAVLSPASPIRKRIFAYGKYFKSMHVVLMSGQTGQGAVKEDGVTVYPTNSPNKLSRYLDALKIGRSVTGVDIVSSQDPFEIGFIAWRIARHHKVPLHIQVHTDFLAPEYAAHSLINTIRVWIAGFVIHRAKHVRVVSQEVYDRLRARYGEKISMSILPIYVDLERFRTAVVPTDMNSKLLTFTKRVLVVARFEPEKNVALAIRAFKESAPPDACLIILGQGSQYTMLERLVTKLVLDPQVFFEGYKDPAPYYKLADVVLVPSVYEGYGQVIIEALAAHKPVIATDVGIAKQSGALITTPEGFAGALKYWFESGPKTMELQNYPYASLEDYVRQYCADIGSVKKEKASK